MSVDVLQEKIRKTKNPSIVQFEVAPDHVPPDIIEREGSFLAAFKRYSFDVLNALKGVVPAVRFGFGSYSILGPDGLVLLAESMKLSEELGYYIILDLPEIHNPVTAKTVVTSLVDSDIWTYHGVVVGTYLGSDMLSPMKELISNGKTVFAVSRTANKSAVEIQDLLTGGRLVYTAAADVINRHGESLTGKCGYSQFGAVAAASSSDCLRTLRSKYTKMFLLIDGYDYPNANAKNCSYGFDKLGHGAIVCAGASVLEAWKEAGNGEACITLAVAAAEKMKKNILRYISVL